MTARPSEKIAATERESSEPMLKLHEEYTHSLAGTAPAITDTMVGRELAALPHLGHVMASTAVNRNHLEAGCFPFLNSFPQTF